MHPAYFPWQAAGLVASLARPGGNTTGFMQLEYSVSGKWLDLLKEIAPSVKRVAVLQNPTSPGAAGQLTVLHAAAPTTVPHVLSAFPLLKIEDYRY